jgi:hypothetical protein
MPAEFSLPQVSEMSCLTSPESVSGGGATLRAPSLLRSASMVSQGFEQGRHAAVWGPECAAYSCQVSMI